MPANVFFRAWALCGVSVALISKAPKALDLPPATEAVVCPRTREPEPGERRIVFLVDGTPSAKMRGNMLSAAVDTLPGWWSTPAREIDRRFRNTSKIDVCILGKFPSSFLIRSCKNKGAFVVHDLLDNAFWLMGNRRDEHIRGPVNVHMESGVDAYITPSESLADVFNQGQPKTIAWTLGHQTTNRGFARRAPSLPFVCKVGILAGTAGNMPNSTLQVHLVNSICASGKAASVAFVLQSPSQSTVFECPLANTTMYRNETMREVCVRQPSGWATRPSSDEQCFKGQDRFQGDKSLAAIDLGVLWPPNYEKCIERPWTRMLYWMSHGVPAIYYPYHAYEDTKAMGYTLPDGEPPVARGFDELAAMVGKVAGNLTNRQYLYARGREIAAQWDTTHVAKKLIDTLNAQLPSVG